VDGTLAGNTEAPITGPFVLNPGALSCGANPGSPVTGDHASLFKFTGTIHSVTVDLSAELIRDHEAELRVRMARQYAVGGAVPGTRRNGRSGRRRRSRQALNHQQRIGRECRPSGGRTVPNDK
jgi:hypothetical protein